MGLCASVVAFIAALSSCGLIASFEPYGASVCVDADADRDVDIDAETEAGHVDAEGDDDTDIDAETDADGGFFSTCVVTPIAFDLGEVEADCYYLPRENAQELVVSEDITVSLDEECSHNSDELDAFASCLVTLPDEQTLCVIVLERLRVALEGVLRMRGPHPVAILSRGDVTVHGTIEVSGHEAMAGPGGFDGAGHPFDDGLGILGNTQGRGGTGSQGGGGGGANLGQGSQCEIDSCGAGGQALLGCADESLLYGGSGGGGSGGGNGGDGDCKAGEGYGGGGGAWLEILSCSSVTFTNYGEVEARGADGGHGCSDLIGLTGGGGGGAGGTVIVVAPTLTFVGTNIDVAGGNGGRGRAVESSSMYEEEGGLGGGQSTNSSIDGGAPECRDNVSYCGGGGGGAGKVYLIDENGPLDAAVVTTVVPANSYCP